MPGFCSTCRSYIPAGKEKCPKCYPHHAILTTRRSTKKYPLPGYIGHTGSKIERTLGSDQNLAAEFAGSRREFEKGLKRKRLLRTK